MSDSRRRARLTWYAFRVIAPLVFAMWLTMANLYFAKVISSDPFKLAALLVALEISTFAFEVPTGIFADSYSRKWSMVIGYVIWGCGFLLQALAPVFEITLLSQALWGLGFTFVSGAPEAWLVDELGQAEAESLFMSGAQIGQASTLAGIALSTLLATVNLALPIAVGGAATILLAGLLAVIMPEAGFKPARRGALTSNLRQTSATAIKLLRGNAAIRVIALLGFVIGSSAGGFDALYTPHIVQNHVLPLLEAEVWFGILFASVTLLTIPAIEILKRLLLRRFPRAITGGLALLAAGTVLGNLVFVWTPWFYLAVAAFCLSQVLRTATKPIFMIWVNRHAPSAARATVISMYWQANASGHIVFAPIVGAIGSLSSLRAALTVTSLALLPAIPLYRRQPADAKAKD